MSIIGHRPIIVHMSTQSNNKHLIQADVSLSGLVSEVQQ